MPPARFLLFSCLFLLVGCDNVQRRDSAMVELDPFRHGEKLFQRYCQHCHQAHGRGLTGTFPPLASSELLFGAPEIPAAIVLLGLQGMIVREGVAYNGVMPGLAEPMNDAEIAAVLSHVRKRWAGVEDAVSAETIQQVRSLLGERRSLWTEAELLRAFR
jgi:mono/diheme cytochrome c family protein